MRLKRFESLLLVTGFAAGCGGSAPPPAATNVALPAASASASGPAVATSEPAPATPTMRTASPEVRKYWTMGDHPKFAMYADLSGLLHTDLLRTLVPNVLAMLKGQLTEEQTRCLPGALEGAKELAFGGDDDALMIVRFDEQVFQPSSCMAAANAARIEVQGAKDAYQFQDAVLAYVPGIQLAGSKRSVTAALALGSGATSWPARLALAPDEYLTWAATVEEELKGHGTLLVSSERLRLSLHADMPVEFAKSAEQQLQTFKTRGSVPMLDGPAAVLASRFLQSVELTRSGGHIDAAFDLHEPTADQARDLQAIATLAVDDVRKYITRAKTAEARNSVWQIARDYQAWWNDGKPRGQKRLVSLPAVPKAIPKGVKYQSSPGDWKPWDRIKFSMDMPQYYQYEVKAAPNGESAEIFARGDLDGDGKPSVFKLSLRVDRKAGSALSVGPTIDETDPDD